MLLLELIITTNPDFMKYFILIFTLIAMSLFSCTTTKTGDITNDKTFEEDLETIDFDAILNKSWRLITLEGQAVELAENHEEEVNFTLQPDEDRLIGFSGCNTITGNYKLEKGNRIRFFNIASTLQTCPDGIISEPAFTKVFELADHYTIAGNKLSLNIGNRDPLAVFETIESR